MNIFYDTSSAKQRFGLAILASKRVEQCRFSKTDLSLYLPSNVQHLGTGNGWGMNVAGQSPQFPARTSDISWFQSISNTLRISAYSTWLRLRVGSSASIIIMFRIFTDFHHSMWPCGGSIPYSHPNLTANCPQLRR